MWSCDQVPRFGCSQANCDRVCKFVDKVHLDRHSHAKLLHRARAPVVGQMDSGTAFGLTVTSTTGARLEPSPSFPAQPVPISSYQRAALPGLFEGCFTARFKRRKSDREKTVVSGRWCPKKHATTRRCNIFGEPPAVGEAECAQPAGEGGVRCGPRHHRSEVTSGRGQPRRRRVQRCIEAHEQGS